MGDLLVIKSANGLYMRTLDNAGCGKRLDQMIFGPSDRNVTRFTNLENSPREEMSQYALWKREQNRGPRENLSRA